MDNKDLMLTNELKEMSYLFSHSVEFNYDIYDESKSIKYVINITDESAPDICIQHKIIKMVKLSLDYSPVIGTSGLIVIEDNKKNIIYNCHYFESEDKSINDYILSYIELYKNKKIQNSNVLSMAIKLYNKMVINAEVEETKLDVENERL